MPVPPFSNKRCLTRQGAQFEKRDGTPRILVGTLLATRLSCTARCASARPSTRRSTFVCVVCDACFICFHAMSTLVIWFACVSIHNSLFVCCSWHNTHALHRFSRCYHAQRIQRAHIVVICPLTTPGCSSYVANFNHVHLRIMQRFTSQRHYVSDMPNHMSKK